MKILAIDTATEACSAALNIDGDIQSVYQLAPREHTQLILPMVDQLLKESGLTLSDIDALSYARGPGAFTGVRIAAGVIQGLSYADQIPVVPVSTLDCMALAVNKKHGHKNVLVAIDARMNEVYFSACRIEEQQIIHVSEECVSAVESLPEIDDAVDWTGAGSGWATYQDALCEKYKLAGNKIYPNELPSSQYIAELAALKYQREEFMSAHQAQPVYLRDNVAKKKQNQ